MSQIFERTLDLSVSAQEAWGWHARPGAFETLRPPWQRIEVVERSGYGSAGELAEGCRLRFRIHQGPFSLEWLAEHRDVEPGVGFRDVQLAGPFAFWEHHHRFEPLAGGCRLVDHITYRLPFGALGRWLGGSFLRRDLERLFAHRHRVTRQALAVEDGSLGPKGGAGRCPR